MKDVEQILFATYENNGLYQIQCSGLVPGPGHVYCTLIVGEERALLIDTGFGDDEFWPYLSEMTGGKPITVVCTHLHPDHTPGVRAFDEFGLDAGDIVDLPKYPFDYDPETKTVFGHTKVRTITRGERYDLGGRVVQSIYTPGHTWGSTCFYDEATKLMIMGDTMNLRTFLHCSVPVVPLATYRDSLNSVMEYEFDSYLGGHHPEPLPRKNIDHLLEMIKNFSVDKAKPYIREGHEGAMMYVEGKGYGDPNYCGFMFRMSDVDDFLKGFKN